MSRLLAILIVVIAVGQGARLASAVAPDDCGGECPDDADGESCPPSCPDCPCCAIVRVTPPDAQPRVEAPGGGAPAPFAVHQRPASGDPAEVFHVPKPAA